MKNLLAVLSILLLAGLLTACGTDQEEKKLSQSPQFELTDLKGDTIKLSDLKGEKVYVKYWASWCSICLAGLEEIDELSASEKDFKVLTIAAPGYNGEMDTEEFKTWFKGLETKNMTVLLDTDGKYAQEFSIRAYPTSVYIDSQGNIDKLLPGHADNQTIIESFKTIK